MDAARVRRLIVARERLRSDELVGLGVLAREACVSPFHFIREYEALFGLTPHQARVEARLGRARELLARGDHSVTEVCVELGMSSLGSFSSWFLKRTGETPREYQRRVRPLVAVSWERVFPGCFSLMGRLPEGAFSQFRRSE